MHSSSWFELFSKLNGYNHIFGTNLSKKSDFESPFHDYLQVTDQPVPKADKIYPKLNRSLTSKKSHHFNTANLRYNLCSQFGSLHFANDDADPVVKKRHSAQATLRV